MALQIVGDGAVARSVQIPDEQRRIHIHVQGETFNFHECLVGYTRGPWGDRHDLLYTDEKGERHFNEDRRPPWIWRTILMWLYEGVFPTYDVLKEWTNKLPADWQAEQNRLNHSIAVRLHVEGCMMCWPGLSDAMTTYLFLEYKKLRLPPSAAHVSQLYDSYYECALRSLFVDLHLKFYDHDCYSDDPEEYVDKWPKDFLFDVFIARAKNEYQFKTDDEKPTLFNYGTYSLYNPDAALHLYRYHCHYTDDKSLDGGDDCETCKTAEMRESFKIS